MRPLLPAILLALVMSIVVGVLAVGRDSGVTLALAVGSVRPADAVCAGAHQCAVLAPRGASRRRTRPSPSACGATRCWRRSSTPGAPPPSSRIYSMSGLIWRHWWQYGVGHGAHRGRRLPLRPPSDRRARILSHAEGARRILMGLTALQGIAVSVALVYLVFSGKLFTPARRLGRELHLRRRQLHARAAVGRFGADLPQAHAAARSEAERLSAGTWGRRRSSGRPARCAARCRGSPGARTALLRGHRRQTYAGTSPSAPSAWR